MNLQVIRETCVKRTDKFKKVMGPGRNHERIQRRFDLYVFLFVLIEYSRVGEEKTHLEQFKKPTYSGTYLTWSTVPGGVD
jgi:hypothetical protein